VLELAAKRARLQVRTRAEVLAALQVVPREAHQLALPLRAYQKRKVTTGSCSETSAIVEGNGVSPIRCAPLPSPRMAKVEEAKPARRAAGGHGA